MTDPRYHIGVDQGDPRGDIAIEERFIAPSQEWPDGSYLCTVDGKVEIATGVYAIDHPDKPSPYFHGRAPFVVLNCDNWPWNHPMPEVPKDAIAFLESLNKISLGLTGAEPILPAKCEEKR